MRGHLLDPDTLVKAVASGRQKGQQPRWRRVELRYVDLKAGRHLQVTSYDDTQAHTANHAVGEAARDAVDELLDEPFGNWHVETTTQSHQVRVTKKLEAMVHTTDARRRGRGRARPRPREEPAAAGGRPGLRGARPLRRLREDEAEPAGEVPPGRGVPAPAGLLDHRRDGQGHLRRPTPEDPLRIVDLGCGNAYLTFAAQRFLTEVRGLPVRLTGVDVKEQSRDHNASVAAELGVDAEFVVGSILGAELDPAARGGARAARLRHRDRRGARPGRRVGGAAGAGRALLPPRHRRPAAQGPTPAPYAMLTRHGILRERLADTLTDALPVVAAAAAGLPRRRRAVRREQAHPAQHDAARGPHRRPRSRAAASARSTTTW